MSLSFAAATDPPAAARDSDHEDSASPNKVSNSLNVNYCTVDKTV